MGKRIGSNKVKIKKFNHRELCFNLAEAKGTRFIEVPLGSVYLSYGSVGQADVITIKPSYNKFNLDIYECKVTRSDFLQDIKSGKYKRYLEHCNRLYFAAPSGIIKKEELPEGVGLIVRGDNGWSTVKLAKKRNIEFNNEMLLSLVFFNGRVYNNKRINLGYVNYRWVDKDRLKGLGKHVKESILNYNNLLLKFNNLLTEASRKITFKSEKEKEDFEDKWDRTNYIR